MTKNEVADAIHDRIGLTKKRSTEITELILDLMKEHLIDGKRVKISGFGNFVVNQKKPRVGRNPQTGEVITIEARRVVTFAPSQVLKKQLNAKEANKQGGVTP